MLLSRTLCLLNRHRPVREEVEWTGLGHVGTCKTCNAPIRRRDAGGWRKRRAKNR